MTPRSVADLPARDDEVAPFLEELGVPGIVDVHVHAMPERLQAAVWRYFDQLEDPPWPVTYRGSLQERLRWLSELGVIAHTALAYPHRPGMLGWLNDFTLGLATDHAQVVPTFTIYPEPDVGAEVERCLALGGRVVKVHLQVGRFAATDPLLDDAWSQIERAGVPVVMHASAVYGVDGGGEYCGAGPVADLLDAHPDLVPVIAHLGRPSTADFLALAEQAPNLRFDTSMALAEPAYADQGLSPTLLERLRPFHDRLLFGSDYPTIPITFAAQLRGLAALELDDIDLAALLHGRAHRLLGLGSERAA